MYHKTPHKNGKGCPAGKRHGDRAHYRKGSPLFGQSVLLIFALLVSHAARGLASRLAGGLALATAAVLYGICNILGFDSRNSFHEKHLLHS
jgi:hypothetical protein